MHCWECWLTCIVGFWVIWWGVRLHGDALSYMVECWVTWWIELGYIGGKGWVIWWEM